MARREVVEILCDRCKRVEMVPKGEAVLTDGEPFFSIKLGDKSASYNDLCKKCRDSLVGYFAHCTLAKKDEQEQEEKETAAAVPSRGILSRITSVKGGG